MSSWSTNRSQHLQIQLLIYQTIILFLQENTIMINSNQCKLSMYFQSNIRGNSALCISLKYTASERNEEAPNVQNKHNFRNVQCCFTI